MIQRRFGISGNYPDGSPTDGTEQSLYDIGIVLGVSQERVRQIEAKALRKLRHPARSKVLKKFLDHRTARWVDSRPVPRFHKGDFIKKVEPKPSLRAPSQDEPIHVNVEMVPGIWHQCILVLPSDLKRLETFIKPPDDAKDPAVSRYYVKQYTMRMGTEDRIAILVEGTALKPKP